MTKTRGWLAVAVALAAALAGCGNKDDDAGREEALEQAIEKDGARANVDLSKGRISIQTKEGQKLEIAGTDGELKIPADFPKDVLVYKGAKVETTVKATEGTMVTLTTPDPTAKVTEAYKADMKKSGWDEKTSVLMPGMTMLQYTKDKRTVSLHISGDDKATLILLTIGAQEGEE